MSVLSFVSPQFFFWQVTWNLRGDNGSNHFLVYVGAANTAAEDSYQTWNFSHSYMVTLGIFLVWKILGLLHLKSKGPLFSFVYLEKVIGSIMEKYRKVQGKKIIHRPFILETV